ncbi:negative elongation factor E-like isoform X2 [Tubulanus polymorphus]|uniref:negative elongation factor E-like isoform X2 n=1 Tax=Tubulanus polymorphus TaxID=672921 RepID=UPI003DA3EA50
MVYMHYPQHLTEEEEMLMKRYAKLRKKKKALQALRAPKPEPEPPEKRQEIKEQAKRLVKAGAIKINNETKKQSFKRKVTRDVEKVHTPASVGFQPFKDEIDDSSDVFQPPAKQAKTTASSAKSMYESFVPESEREQMEQNSDHKDVERRRHRSSDRRDSERKHEPLPPPPPRREPRDYPKKGKTIYVSGRGISEMMIRENFAKFDKITNIHMELDKNCCFVTFESLSGSELAIQEMDRNIINDVYLRVSVARRQPNYDAPSGEQSKTAWSSIAASNSQKGSHKDKRHLVTYDDSDDIF